MSQRRKLFNPVSLQDHCLLSIICNLEAIPPSLLACLPTQLRYPLLRNLPAADLSQLETTNFVDGVETQEIWEDLCCLLPEGEGPLLSDFEGNSKRQYFFYTLFVVLHKKIVGGYTDYRKSALDFMFSVDMLLGIDNWKTAPPPFKYVRSSLSPELFVPPRFLKYYTHNLSDQELTTLLMEKCCYTPYSLPIACDLFQVSEFWQCDNVMQTFRLLCSSIKEVRFEIDGDPDVILQRDQETARSVRDVPPFVMNMILSNKSPHLTSLFIANCGEQMTGEIVKSVESLFGDSFTKMSSTHASNVPYTGLKAIKISADSGLHPLIHQTMSDAATCSLTSIVANQSSLESITLTNWSPNVKSNAYSTLWSTVRYQPSLVSVEVSETIMPLASLLDIIFAFLSSQHIHKQKQSLCLTVSHISTNDVDQKRRINSPYPFEMADDSLMNTSLSISCDKLGEVMSWLSSCRTLRFAYLELDSTQPTADTQSIVKMMGYHPNFQVKKLSLSHNTVPDSLEDFDILFSKFTTLTALELCCDVSENGLLMKLTCGLHKHASVGTLRILNLRRTRLGHCPDHEIQLFFYALFSLPRLEDLSVKLEHNCLTTTHVAILVATWKEKGHGKKLWELHIGGNDHQFLADSLASVCSNVVM